MAAPRKRVTAQAAKPKSLPEVVAAGDRRASLQAVRDELARRLVDADKDAAAIARQLTTVLRELDELPNPAEESKVDDLANRRAARVAKAASQ